MAPAAEGVSVEEAALGHGASGTVEAVVNRMTFCMTGLPFLSTPLITGKMTEGVDDTCFGGMGACGAADDRRETTEALIWFQSSSVWVAVYKVN